MNSVQRSHEVEKNYVKLHRARCGELFDLLLFARSLVMHNLGQSSSQPGHRGCCHAQACYEATVSSLVMQSLGRSS